MERTRTTALIAMTIALLAPLALAQGPGAGKRARNYNPATEVTVKGTVEQVLQPPGRRGFPGTHLELKSDQGTFDVHVGPDRYISAQGFSFAKGDQIEVTGSKVKMGGKDVLLAREITKDGKVLKLRNSQGIPEWSAGWQRPN